MESTPMFDWVKLRAGCSLENAFRLLADRVQFDVNSMNKVSPATTFTLTTEDERLFVAKTRDVNAGSSHGVVFKLLGEGIRADRVVPPIEEPLFLATSALTTAGECKLHIDGEPFELWQVSRKALDSLFFPFS
jgi:hypothetical protein